MEHQTEDAAGSLSVQFRMRRQEIDSTHLSRYLSSRGLRLLVMTVMLYHVAWCQMVFECGCVCCEKRESFVEVDAAYSIMPRRDQKEKELQRGYQTAFVR